MKQKFTAIILVTLFFTSNCSTDTFHYYKDNFEESIQDPKDRKFKGNENDVNDLRGCQWLLKVEKWENNGRYESWFDGRIYRGTGVNLDPPIRYFKKLKTVFDKKLLYIIYIGPWHYSPRIQKTIRFFAYYPKEGGDIKYQYESQTEENKNIPQQAFNLSSTAKIAPDRFGLCVVKWTAKYGYNAIAEVKSKNPFSKNYLVPTGRIIDSETGQIIEAKE